MTKEEAAQKVVESLSDEKCRELLAIALLAMLPHPFIKIERETTPDWALKQQISTLKQQCNVIQTSFSQPTQTLR